MASRVLVVDDDEALAALIRDVLVAQGYAVDSVGNARDCFARLEDPASLPALVVMDVMLPDQDGFEALGRLRGSKATSAIPVILVSTLQGKSYRERAREGGAAAYLAKPFEPTDLVEAVRRALAGPAAR